MFDNVPLKNQGSVPNNLPIGEPEDMFAAALSANESNAVGPSSAPDAAPSALSAGVLQPKDIPTSDIKSEDTSVRFRTPAPLNEPNINTASVSVDAGSSVSHMIVIVLALVLLVGIFGGVGWWVYNTYIVTSSIGRTNTIQKNNDQTSVDKVQTSNGQDVNNVSDQLLFGSEADSDADGLSDTRETQIGTDPRNWDTDGDGLSDYNEVVVWKTDPHNIDTDGDGFKDGQEVTNGYNPAGPGKIFQPPSTTSAVVQ